MQDFRKKKKRKLVTNSLDIFNTPARDNSAPVLIMSGFKDGMNKHELCLIMGLRWRTFPRFGEDIRCQDGG